MDNVERLEWEGKYLLYLVVNSNMMIDTFGKKFFERGNVDCGKKEVLKVY